MIKQWSPLVFFAAFSIAQPASANVCLPDDHPGEICRAGDFTLTEQLVTGPPSCTEGELIPVDITLHLGMEPTGKDRYDIGIFVGDSGQSPIGGSSCTFSSLTPQTTNPTFNDLTNGNGPFRDIDGNSCGDTTKTDGFVYRDVTLSDVLCTDSNNDGKLDIPYALSWKSSVGQCNNPNDPAQFFPDQSSKCINWVGDIDEIVVLPPVPIPSIDVSKTAFPKVIHVGDTVTYSISVTNDGDV